MTPTTLITRLTVMLSESNNLLVLLLTILKIILLIVTNVIISQPFLGAVEGGGGCMGEPEDDQ